MDSAEKISKEVAEFVLQDDISGKVRTHVSRRKTETETKWRPNDGKQNKRPGSPVLGLSRSGHLESKNNPPFRTKMCNLCKANKEMPHVYTSHDLRNSKGEVTCPVLFSYICPDCGATGPRAHTRSYCPKAPVGQRSIAQVLKTPRNCAGKFRKAETGPK